MRVIAQPNMRLLRDPAILGHRFDEIVRASPVFLGLGSAAPSPRDAYASIYTRDAHLMTRGMDGELRVFLNTCRHRNGQIVPVGMTVDGKKIPRQGKTLPNGNIGCKWHNWVYDGTSGKLFGAPTFRGDEKPCAKQHSLHAVGIEQVGDLVFLAGSGAKEHLADAFTSPGFARRGVVPFRFAEPMRLFDEGKRLDDFAEDFHTITFMEVYGDTDHVDDIHRDSFNQLVSMGSLELEYSTHWSVQFVGWRETTTRVCDEYSEYRRMVLARSGGKTPEFGAIWMSYGPNMTFEWYPLGMKDGRAQHAFVASVCVPRGTGCYNVVEFFFPEQVLRDEPELAHALMRAYAVTAREDRDLCNSMERGRQALVDHGRGDDVLGPAHPLQEGCVTHYYNLLGCLLEGTVPTREAVAA